MNFVEVAIRTGIDSGELLALLDDGESLGAWEADGIVHLFWTEDRWNPASLAELKSVLEQL